MMIKVWNRALITLLPALIAACIAGTGGRKEQPVDTRRTCPPGFVDLADFIPGILADVRYAGRDNFTGRVLDG